MQQLTELFELSQTQIQSAAIRAYRDPKHVPRRCDRCNHLYRGPALHCSLSCAVADA